ncbi:MAG: hypothetical protein SFW67_34745 [Myxococcaceae bacterium]|nr:hypothetical protein [Myxococcaceae bacterium]
MSLPLQLDPVPLEAVAHLIAVGAIEAPRAASVLANARAARTPEGAAASSRLGLVASPGAPLERPRLLEALKHLAACETLLHLEVQGDRLTFASLGETLIPVVPVPRGVVVGEPLHLSQLVKRLRQLLETSPGRLASEVVHLRGTQAVQLVWGALRRAVKLPVTAPEVRVLLGAALAPVDVEGWFELGAGWLERRLADFGIIEARQPLATLLLKGRTVTLSRQEGLRLVLDVELVGRSGRWAVVTRARRGELDESIALTPMTTDAVAALVDGWVGLADV